MIKQHGMALILVLWVLSLLTIMASGFVINIRRETAILSNAKDTVETTALAESGIELAKYMLLNPDLNKRWHIDGNIYEVITDHAKLRIRLLSETGKINLNTAEQQVLQQLFSRSPNGTDAKLPFATINRAAAILDWRDTDDFVRINGAEKKQYEDAQINYSPSNQNIQTLDELQMILGMDETTLKWLEPLITIYGHHTEVDLQLASKEVLQILLANPQLAQQYVYLRAENAKHNLPPPVINSANLSQPSILDTLTIISEAHKNESVAIIYTVIKKTSNPTTPFQHLSWQYNKSQHHSLFADDMNELVIKHYAEPELDN